MMNIIARLSKPPKLSNKLSPTPSPIERTNVQHDTEKAPDTAKDSQSISSSDGSLDAGVDELSPKEWRWLKFKCSSFYMIMGIAYSVQYLDKACVSAGSVMGLRQDLGMKGNMFSWVNSAYFIGYLVGCIICALPFLEKLGPHWNGYMLTAWGIITACSGGVQNYAGFIAIRTLLGLLESFCEPTITVMTAQWTHPEEQFGWVETWFAWNGFAQIFLQSVGFGLYTRQERGDYSIKGWRILFIILGLMTVVLGVAFILLVPNSPQEAPFLSDKEKAAMRRTHFNEDNRKFKRRSIEWRQILESFTTDIVQTGCLFFAIICNSINGGAINTYINLILKQFIVDADHNLTDFQSNKRSLLYGMIPGGIKLGVCSIISVVYLMGVLRKYRFAYILPFSGLHVASACMLVWGKHPNTRLAGTYMYNTSVEVAHGGLISLIASNAVGMTKKIVVNSVQLVGFSVGNIAGPQAFTKKASKTPSGRRALATLSAVSFGVIILLMCNYIILNARKNKKNEKLPEGADPQDLTDRENPEFRYHL